MALPVTAQAACPVQADLFIGIVLVQNDPFVSSTFQITNMGLVENRRVKQAHAFQDTLTIYAHPLAAQFLEFPQTGLSARFAYHRDLSDLNRLDKLGDVEMPISAWIDGEPAIKGTFHTRLADKGSINIAECRYDFWDVVTETALDGMAVTRTQVKYAPDLGLVLNPTWIDGRDTTLSTVIYNWIGTAADIRR